MSWITNSYPKNLKLTDNNSLPINSTLDDMKDPTT